MLLAAGWSENAVGIVAVAFLFAGITIAIWQLFATLRARMAVAREEAYRELAQESTDTQRRTAEALERTVAELTDLRQRTSELERVLKEVG